MPDDTKGGLFKRIRLLRKKLQQIENLKLLDRCLNDEEELKVSREDEFRGLLTELRERYEAVVSEDSDNDDFNPRPQQTLVVDSHSLDKEKQNTDRSISTSSTPSSHNVAEQQPIPRKLPEQKYTDTKAVSASRPGSQGNKQSKEEKTKSKNSEGTDSVPDPVIDPVVIHRNAWAKRYWSISDISSDDSHTDLILCVHLNHQYIVSSSRDTTLKLWDTHTGKFIRSYGGHTESVNAVKLISYDSGEDESCIIVSGGEDCTLKLWHTISGAEIVSDYLYNPITCLEVISSENHVAHIAVGMSGGKLHIYRLTSTLCKLELMVETTVDTDRISCISSDTDRYLAVGGSDGVVTILDISHMTSVRCIYRLEDHAPIPITSLSLQKGAKLLISFKDEPNLTIIYWKTNTAITISNHRSDVGVTDSIVSMRSTTSGEIDHILVTGFDIDAGCALINVRDSELDENSYICSLYNTEVQRILSMSATSIPVLQQVGGGDSSSGGGDRKQLLTIVTGGRQLILWKEEEKRSDDSVLPCLLRLKLHEAHIDSSCTDESDHEADEIYSKLSPNTRSKSSHMISQGTVRRGTSTASVCYLLFSVAVLLMPIIAWYLAQS